MPDFRKTLSNALQIFVALVYLQTLYFKFSAHPDSVYIFSTLGIEPAGRILVGILEGITAALILIPKTRLPGAILSIGVISGAILAHMGPLGIEVKPSPKTATDKSTNFGNDEEVKIFRESDRRDIGSA